MQPNFRDMSILYAGADSFEDMKHLPARKIFDEDVCIFLQNLSTQIRADRECLSFPDLAAFGFFCRRANIEKLKEAYTGECRIGRGFSFHVAPSNVPVNFAYSLAAGLLSGCACAVRASSKKFRQTEILCRLICNAAKESSTMISKYVAVIQYTRNMDINNFLSAMSDVRVIWGGDQTVKEIRKGGIPPRGVDIAFADRFSACVLYAEEILNICNWQQIAHDFYNDTYLYDQNACSSPHLMFWIGKTNEIALAKEVFWDSVYQYVSKRYVLEPATAVDKLVMDYRAAMDKKDVRIVSGKDNLIHRIQVSRLETADLERYTCPGGSFLEYDSEDISGLEAVVGKKLQTLTYLGGNGKKIAEWVVKKGLSGADRIVPMGKAADFTLVWDGYDLIREMSRNIYYR